MAGGHTFATLGLQAGVHPKIMADLLGHSSAAITLNVYSHAIPAVADEAVSRVVALFDA
jgi:integrase